MQLSKGVHVGSQLFHLTVYFNILSGVILIEKFWFQLTQSEIGRLELFLLLLELARFDAIIFNKRRICIGLCYHQV